MKLPVIAASLLAAVASHASFVARHEPMPALACQDHNCIGSVDPDGSATPTLELACTGNDCRPAVEPQTNPSGAIEVACHNSDCSPATSA